MLFIYDWPSWLAGSLIVALCVALMVAIAGAAASFGLVFFFIIALDHPYAGETSNGPGPFLQVLQSFDRLDRGAVPLSHR